VEVNTPSMSVGCRDTPRPVWPPAGDGALV